MMSKKLLISLAFLSCMVGIVLGILFQRQYGAARMLRAIGVLDPLPTPTAVPPTPTPTPAGVPEALHGKLSLFVLAGQSNMSGVGVVPADQPIDTRVFMFGNDYQWKIAAEPVDSPVRQVDKISEDGGAGFSPSLPFALSLLETNPELRIGLIPCANGNTTIEQWQRHLSDSTLYGSCLKRIRAASTMGEVTAVLFFQGESDALDPATNQDRLLSAFDYETKFTTFIENIREDLGLSSLPVVFAQIGTNEVPQAFINWKVVQNQQASIELPCVTMITTLDLALQDGVHYTRESYRIIGQRFAAAYTDLVANQVCQ
jgi:hypothetical protein